MNDFPKEKELLLDFRSLIIIANLLVIATQKTSLIYHSIIYFFNINVMQWDIRYAENSPQADYLKQYELLQEDEVQPHLLDLPQQEGFNFLEKEGESDRDESQRQQKISYASYLSNLLWTPNLTLKKKPAEIVLLLFGDLVEQSYLNNNYEWIKIRRGIFKDLGLLLLILFYWPFLIIPLLFIFYNLPSEGILITQTQMNFDLRKRFCEISQTIKLNFLHSKSKVNIQQLKLIIGQIKARFALTEVQSERPIDQLDEVVYLINTRSISSEWQRKIGQTQPWFQRKRQYIRLKLENSRIQEAISSLSSVIKDEETKNSKDQVKNGLPINIYYSIFINRLAQATTIQEKKALFSILRKQIDYRQVYRHRHLDPQPEQESQDDQNDSQEVVEEIVKQKIEDSLCYQDEDVLNYQPEDPNVIKIKLEELLKHQIQKKKEKEEKNMKNTEKLIKNQQEEHQMPSFLSQMRKNERFSFGIAITPPARDMSAYYIS